MEYCHNCNDVIKGVVYHLSEGCFCKEKNNLQINDKLKNMRIGIVAGQMCSKEM